MESSPEDKTKTIDESVGGLVWVRRRNGSWWPGRILGTKELPESCLAFPRSGTPIKLLGREDASIDWYNLEKSKRVKPFRCGEYDECIEKAKASAANSLKKAVKYARREVAILHALDLESARQSKDQEDMCSTIDIPCGEKNDMEVSLTTLLSEEETDHMAEELSSFQENSNSGEEASHSSLPFEELNSKEQSTEGKRRRTPIDSEDDGAEGIKRMRGLEDLNMDVLSSFKKKRSQLANGHDHLKKRSRHRQLTKVLESTVMVTVPVVNESLASPSGSSILGVADSKLSALESTESKRNASVVIQNNSGSAGENGTSLNASRDASDALLIDCKQKENEISDMLGPPDDNPLDKLFDVPFVGADNQLPGFSSMHTPCASQKPKVGSGGQYCQSSQVQTVSLGNEEFNESGSVSSGAADANAISNRIEKGTSKWKLKGKRNLRNACKNKKHGLRKLLNVDDKSNGYLEPGDLGGAFISEGYAYQAISKPVMETQVDELQVLSRQILKKESDMSPTAKLAAPQRLQPYRQSRSTINPKYQSDEYPLRVCNPDSFLYDVNLEVKVSHHTPHVPFISLVSKLSGKPVIGHPLTVEAVDDGLCDILIGGSNCFRSRFDWDEIDELHDSQVVNKRKQSPGGKRVPGNYGALQLRPSRCKKSKYRRNGLLAKKIRKLSSLTGSRRRAVEAEKPIVQELKGPAIACVPLKVVFSRINAAFNRSI